MKNNNIRLCGDHKIDSAAELWRAHRRRWRESTATKNNLEAQDIWIKEFNKMIKNNT